MRKEKIEEYINNIINYANKIGNYSGYYQEKMTVLNNAYALKKELNIKDNAKEMTLKEIEEELGYKIKIKN